MKQWCDLLLSGGASTRRMSLTPLWRARPWRWHRPSRAKASAPRRRCAPRSSRTRCAGRAARRDRRRCRRRRLLCRATAARPLTNAACASAASRVTAGSTTFRQTEVLERSAGSAARKSIHGVRATQSAITLALASARALQRRQAADRLRPFERVEIILDAQHRRRVDGLALENAFVDLAALGHAEDLRQRPRRRVALQPGHGARRQNQHAVRGLAAERLLPGEGDDIELGPVERLGERGRGRVADRQALRGRPRSSRHSATRTPEVVPFQVKTTSLAGSTLARSGNSP